MIPEKNLKIGIKESPQNVNNQINIAYCSSLEFFKICLQ